jgi:hypothetical protein
LGGSAALGVAYVLAEVVLRWLGASFLYVTSHFVLMPLLSLVLLGAIALRALRQRDTLMVITLFVSSIIPAAILWITVKADPATLSFLGPFRAP